MKVFVTQTLTAKGRALVKKVILFQCVITIVCTSFGMFFEGQDAALSAFIGGAICVIPNFLFGLLAFRYAGGSKNQLVVRSFNFGSKLKLVLSIFLFVAAYQWSDIQALPMMVAYVVTLASQWPYLIHMARTENSTNH